MKLPMMMTLSAPALALLMAATVSHAADPIGTWLTETGETKVEIEACGSSLCGKIVWVNDGGTDINNPDPAMQTRPLLGLRIIYVSRKRKAGYVGELYNYKDGHTYRGILKVLDKTKIKLSGCRRHIICRSQTWTKIR
jgi:uncharacterized protein (DUF2147 family)